MTGLIQYSGLFMPSSIPANFAEGFAKLAVSSDAVPFGIANLGTSMTPADPLPPLLAIDGSERPAAAPGLTVRQFEKALESSSGYAQDWKILQDLLDRPSPVGFHSMKGYRGRTVRDLLAHLNTPNFSPGAFSLHMPKEPSDSTASKSAESYFIEGAILANTRGKMMLAYSANYFRQAIPIFAEVDCPFAIAMFHELIRVVEVKVQGRPSSETLRNEADMWLKGLKQGDALSFDTAYPRALHAAVASGHPGSGLLEDVFKAGISRLLNIDKPRPTPLVTAILGAMWARLMKADLRPEGLTEKDWREVDYRILTLWEEEHFLGNYYRLEGENYDLAHALTGIVREILSKFDPSIVLTIGFGGQS